MNKKSRILRIVAIVLLGLSVAFTLLGGAGSTCIAFNPEAFGSNWASFITVKPIMQVLVFVSLAAAAYGIYSIIRLVRGARGAFVPVIIFLVVGAVASAVQYYLSLTLRGSTAPNNIRLYTTVLTLLVLLLLRLPRLWTRTGFESGSDSGGTRMAGGMAAILCGIVTLTTPLWAAPTHIVAGFNTTNVLFWPLMIGGGLLLVSGGVLLTPRRTEKMIAALRTSIAK